jgi:hypothetical protein
MAALIYVQQAQLKETIEKYGPVRQPVRETTMKILRCDVLNFVWFDQAFSSSLLHDVCFHRLNLVWLQVRVQRMLQEFAHGR